MSTLKEKFEIKVFEQKEFETIYMTDLMAEQCELKNGDRGIINKQNNY